MELKCQADEKSFYSFFFGSFLSLLFYTVSFLSFLLSDVAVAWIPQGGSASRSYIQHFKKISISSFCAWEHFAKLISHKLSAGLKGRGGRGEPEGEGREIPQKNNNKK